MSVKPSVLLGSGISVFSHPATIAKFHAGRIIQSALDAGWQPPEKYSPLKRARIADHLQRLANKWHKVPNASRDLRGGSRVTVHADVGTGIGKEH